MENITSRRDFIKSATAATILSTMPAGKIMAAPENPQNATRLHLGCCAYSYRKYLKNGEMKLDQFLHLAANLGFDGVQLTTYYYESSKDEYLFGLKHLAYKLGLDIPSIAIRTNFCTADEAERSEQVENTKKWVDVAVKLGAIAIRIFGGKVPKGAPLDDAIAWTAAGIREAVEYAGSKGVFLALENHGGVTERAENVVRIYKRVNHPWLGLLLDTGNFPYEPYSQIAEDAPYAITTHFKGSVPNRNDKRIPVDVDRVFKILRDAQYQGYLNIEYEGKEDPMTGVPKLLEQMKKSARKYSLV